MNHYKISLFSILVVFIFMLTGAATAQAALAAKPLETPVSSYSQYLQSLDAIIGRAKIPVFELRQTSPVLAGARSLIGRPVVWGGASPAEGFDCSGLVQYVFRQAGINLPRTADLQFLVGRTVSPAALQPGDLVYYTTYEPGASHVGIYIGADKFIHTSFSQGVVAIADINDPYFVQRFYGAKRVV